MESNNLCRLCALDKGRLLPIFDMESEDIIHKILDHLHIQITESDPESKTVCIECYTKVQNFHDFFTNCRRVQSILKLMVTPSEVKQLPNKAIASIIDQSSQAENVVVISDEPIDMESHKSQINFNIIYTAETDPICKEENKSQIESNDEELDQDMDNCSSIGLEETITLETKDNILKCGSSDPINTVRNNSKIRHLKPTAKVVKKPQSPEKQIRRELFQMLKCSECKELCKGRKFLAQHFTEVHKKSVAFLCPSENCEQTFKIYRSFTRHVLNHQSVKQFECNLCNRSFAQKTSLANHQLTHSNDKNFKCEICNRAYRQIGSLYNHKKTHFEAKPNCAICNSNFTNLITLKNHMKSKHSMCKSDEYVCNECGKSFASYPALKYHRIAHENIKNFECDNCHKKFFYKSLLDRHSKIHLKNG